jgi:hypothetical protein
VIFVKACLHSRKSNFGNCNFIASKEKILLLKWIKRDQLEENTFWYGMISLKKTYLINEEGRKKYNFKRRKTERKKSVHNFEINKEKKREKKEMKEEERKRKRVIAA